MDIMILTVLLVFPFIALLIGIVRDRREGSPKAKKREKPLSYEGPGKSDVSKRKGESAIAALRWNRAVNGDTGGGSRAHAAHDGKDETERKEAAKDESNHEDFMKKDIGNHEDVIKEESDMERKVEEKAEERKEMANIEKEEGMDKVEEEEGMDKVEEEDTEKEASFYVPGETHEEDHERAMKNNPENE